MVEQIISTSSGCPYSCPYCFNGKNEFGEFDIPEIKSDFVILHDDAFLSRENVLSDIEKLGSKRINRKVVHYELKQGINLRDLTPEIAQALKVNRFIKIKFAWDDSYTTNNYRRVYDGIKLLENAGYKREDMLCFVLSNYYVGLRECLFKLKILLYRHIPVCNCRYRKYYHDPNVYPNLWTQEEIDYFQQECRFNNQLIKFKGYDPEIRKRLIQCKSLPKKLKRSEQD